MQSECASHLGPGHAIHSKLRQSAASQELRGLHFSHSIRARLAPPRRSRPLEISVDFVGKLVGYVHCTRTALSYPDWCGSPVVLNAAPNGSAIGGLRWPNGQLLGAGWSG